ncbi:MAG: nuclear transport factor 2 family protein [Hyphomicrobiaceae bacterium]|nr:MAG: nuclear transport factor 2 family protein [Hyphomicrobiaceae bacterium]
MDASQNKQLMQQIFAGLANGDARPFVESLADDFRWVMTGTTKWSKTYAGKEAVLAGLFGALRASIDGRIKTVAHRFIADGDHVVVEARGDNMTKAGKPYCNTYCMVIRLADGKLKELTEYLDTELVTAVLGDPNAG